MALTTEDIERVAHLARLSITPLEAEEVRQKLLGLFGLIEQMCATNTTGIEPMAHAQEVSSPLREDQVSERDQRELFQSLAPTVEEGLYLVPKVIE